MSFKYREKVNCIFVIKLCKYSCTFFIQIPLKFTEYEGHDKIIFFPYTMLEKMIYLRDKMIVINKIFLKWIIELLFCNCKKSHDIILVYKMCVLKVFN